MEKEYLCWIEQLCPVDLEVVELDLSNSTIEELSPNINRLICDSTSIKFLPLEIGQLEKLEILAIAYSLVGTLPIEISSLQELYISGTTIPKFTNLKTIYAFELDFLELDYKIIC